MIVGLGVDLVSVDRIERAIGRHGQKFLEKVFTQAEIDHCSRRTSPEEGYAVRFCAKEAGMKALGSGLGQGVNWRDVEVVSLESGKPVLMLHGRAKEIADGLGATRVLVSLSHERGRAIATVILEKTP